jgi:nitrogen fixation protein FixH
MLMSTEVAAGDVSRSGRRDDGKRLTGRAVVLWLAGGFGVMFAANFALIYVALSTLHGEEVENSYDASQIYNAKLAAARAQDQLGWTVNVSTRQENGGARVVADFRDKNGAMIPGLQVQARFLHPFDRGSDRAAVLANDGGEYEGFAQNLKAGRWTLDLDAKLNGEPKFFSENKLVLKDDAE